MKSNKGSEDRREFAESWLPDFPKAARPLNRFTSSTDGYELRSACHVYGFQLQQICTRPFPSIYSDSTKCPTRRAMGRLTADSFCCPAMVRYGTSSRNSTRPISISFPHVLQCPAGGDDIQAKLSERGSWRAAESPSAGTLQPVHMIKLTMTLAASLMWLAAFLLVLRLLSRDDGSRGIERLEAPSKSTNG